jgi:hypothetical protein
MFQLYVAMWVTQFALVLISYFQKSVGLDEFERNRETFSKNDEEGVALTIIGGSAYQKVDTAATAELEGKQLPQEQYQRVSSSFLSRMISVREMDSLTVAEESAEMKSVPWSAQKNPEGSANIFSRLFFSWMSPLFAYAHKHTIEEYDVWDLRSLFRFQ